MVTSKYKRQQITKKSSVSGCLVKLGAIAALMTMSAAIAGSIWLAIRLTIDPNSVSWLNQFLPEWTRIPIADASPPQTLRAIQNEVRDKGLVAGESISLNTGEPFPESPILLPLLKSQPNCQTNCLQIVELRVYQPTLPSRTETTYQLVHQLTITPPEEYFVLSSLADTEATNVGASHTLPLKKLDRLDDRAPATGLWFNLWGQQRRDGSPMNYGQIIHYNPDYTHLSVMVEWTSPNESQPYWQQVTGESTPELVINQTVDLEPQFKVYQIQPRQFVPNPIALEEISLAQPALDTPTYRKALMLARNGLWSTALRWLQPESKINELVAAQAQMDVIRLHAQFTESQANQIWATPSQQILAYLIDGRWVAALQVVQASGSDAEALQKIAALLKSDSGGLWQRVEAALKANSDDRSAKTWGALILTIQEGRDRATAWLKQLPSTQPETTTPDDYADIYAFVGYLDAALVQASPITTHLSQIVGTAQSLKNVKPEDWLQPGAGELSPQSSSKPLTNPLSALKNPLPTLQKEPQHIWYQVQVAAFNDGQRWRQAPFSNLQLSTVDPGRQLWKYLGLDTDPRIQIAVSTADGRQESIIAMVKAVSYRGGIIQLLAAGDALPAEKQSRPLAYTETALRWLEPGSISLSDLNQLQPQWVTAIMPVLWSELVKSGKQSSQTFPSMPVMLQEMGHWLVQPIDLTGNSQPEAVLTLYENLAGGERKLDIKRPEQDSKQYKPRTLIFSERGVLLYSEFSKDASTSLTAIADLGDGGSAALVLDGKSFYSLKRWSPQRQRFE
ncbi:MULTISPECIES: hypothetical protein [unclassified Coleofasciculus]|uniref:hypothetical protein n=1 Tax=unclassified Coleofasciculus TaxID=2692782 RepID=UPI00187FC98A|nr:MULTISPECIES: hypothetical protein [unclassified Coleofasciculus]MBE9126943.1 hypothetical protein [Coleofasciculus sp. LEGE 07081]MBE9148646.1 hypothetical protein [Coleofasciculus sp. LEGE 07092]